MPLVARASMARRPGNCERLIARTWTATGAMNATRPMIRIVMAPPGRGAVQGQQVVQGHQSGDRSGDPQHSPRDRARRGPGHTAGVRPRPGAVSHRCRRSTSAILSSSRLPRAPGWCSLPGRPLVTRSPSMPRLHRRRGPGIQDLDPGQAQPEPAWSPTKLSWMSASRRRISSKFITWPIRPPPAVRVTIAPRARAGRIARMTLKTGRHPLQEP